MQAWHTGVWGDSGGGKTTLLREMHATFKGVSIVVNHTGEYGFEGRRAASPEKAGEIIQQAASWSNIRINYRSQRPAKQQVRELRRLCGEIWDYAGVPQQLLVDEIFELIPDYKQDSGPGSGNPIIAGLKEDRDQGTKVVIATQDPTELYYPAVKQLQYHVWCGRPAKFHRGFMDYMGFPRDELMALDDHEYLVLDKQAKVVDRGQTKEQYA